MGEGEREVFSSKTSKDRELLVLKKTHFLLLKTTPTGWKPAPKAPGEEDPRSIMARLFDGAGDRAAAAKAAAAAGSSSSAVAVVS